MKIIIAVRDNSINMEIRKYGLTRLAKKIGVTPSLISQALRDKCAISEEVFLKIRKVLQ